MAKIQVPVNFQKFTGNKSFIEVDGATVSTCFAALWKEFPELKSKILNDNGNLQRYVRVFVDGQDSEDLGGLSAPTTQKTTIKIMTALAGG